jgi:cellulose synthase/poly-beta-1,6-N-acetylglucosamine synthase-like glycosyltransferase
MAGRMAVLLTRKHPELDTVLTRVTAHAQAAGALDEGGLAQLLAAVLELEKPDLGKLATLVVGGENVASVYRRGLLEPLYRTLLEAAYRLGVREALGAPFDASIVLPVRDPESARRTLVRLAEVTDGSFEVIVVDDGAPEETRAFLASLCGDVQMIRNAEPEGVVPAWNRGARAARGRHLVFLGPEASPGRGWLGTLVGRAERDPAVAGVATDDAGVPALLVRRDRFEAVGGFCKGDGAAGAHRDLRARLEARGWRVERVGEEARP